MKLGIYLLGKDINKTYRYKRRKAKTYKITKYAYISVVNCWLLVYYNSHNLNH